ncbi:MAG: ATP-dependent DNA helicase RecQ, partial [Planctomycetaceae bacterium]|nr:ATP-dependent DNA helicase RecQ [Planctomycetaceae bacterium]
MLTPVQTLERYFGFQKFRGPQLAIIEHVLTGGHALVIMPTGGGKSLCFQIPALVLARRSEGADTAAAAVPRRTITLVLSPLIALMKDQIDALQARGIDAVRLDSTLSWDEYRNAVDRLRRGTAKLLYVSPERFLNERFRELLTQLPIALFAVDEAHCISEWGHNFRPDYLKLARFAQQCGAERRFALTATATPDVMRDICQEFEIDDDCAIRTEFYRPNLKLLTTAVTESTRDEELVRRLCERPRGATVVYVTLQRTAEEVAARLAASGLPARAYHAGLETEVRTSTQDWFLAESDAIIVATIAFGMGIDKPDIRYIYHYNLAKSLENYSQEIGRAGRDGEPSTCETLACGADLRTLENFIFGDTPTAAAVHSLVVDLFSSGPEFSVSIYDLSATHDIRNLV